MNKLKVDAIRNGTVIDHIPAGAGLRVLRIIGEEQTRVVAVGMNLPSKSNEKKDIVKIEGIELKHEEVNQIALIAPHATINIIREFEVKEKYNVKIPSSVKGHLLCPNPNCVTNMEEELETTFNVSATEPVQLQCSYCERTYFVHEVRKI